MMDRALDLILVVDDEDELREVIVEDLGLENYKVLSASSGNQAFQLIKENPNIGLVFSDIRMKDGDGYDLLINIRKLSKTSPIVYLMSGFSDFSEKDLLSAGAQGVLEKPRDMGEICTIANSIFGD